MAKTIEDLPDEILEYIMALLSPYHDLQSCNLTNKKWHLAVGRVVKRRQLDLYRAIKSNTLRWHYGNFGKIPMRYSQAACYLDGIMYVFGGCSTGETTFNDLLALDLTSRKLKRVSATGSFPSPKASATLCAYQDKLILFGGWTYPSRLSLHAPQILFKELHIFDTVNGIWISKPVPLVCPPCAGHSATVHGSRMVVVGGVNDQQLADNGSNLVSYLDLEAWEWSFPEISSVKPEPRFGHSQIYIDSNHLVLIGGSRGTSMPRGSHDDAWLLQIGPSSWTWKQIAVQNPQWAPPHLWCNPVVRVGTLLVAFGRCSSHDVDMPCPSHDRDGQAEEPKEENVNGKRGSFSKSPTNGADTSPERVRLGSTAKRTRQLEALAKFEKIFSRSKKGEKSLIDERPHMNLYSADISRLLTNGIMTWQEPKYSPRTPTNRILYSLVTGHSELIMFGGMAASGEDLSKIYGNTPVLQNQAWAFGVAPVWMP